MTETSRLMVCIAAIAFMIPSGSLGGQSGPTDAPTGFDNQTNGFVSQAEFDLLKGVYERRKDNDGGLGPVYNAESCSACHSNPVTGGISQVTELRAGRMEGNTFVEHRGGSLVHSRAIDATIQETVQAGNDIGAFRASQNTLGDGFVECIADSTLIQIAEAQAFWTRGAIAGQVIMVPVLEAGGALRVGRFGWKNQHASLVSFAADALLNEMGITNPLEPAENTSNGASVAEFDKAIDPEDNGREVEALAAFMRATKAPPRDSAKMEDAEVLAGDALFTEIGCALCHTPSIVTAPTGTIINGGAFVVPPALGGKVIHPYGDFLLHDIGTGDGIVQNGGQESKDKLRTAPLWGVRTRNRLMHDGESLSFEEAILRHKGEASIVTSRFLRLSKSQVAPLIAFLKSL